MERGHGVDLAMKKITDLGSRKMSTSRADISQEVALWHIERRHEVDLESRGDLEMRHGDTAQIDLERWHEVSSERQHEIRETSRLSLLL